MEATVTYNGPRSSGGGIIKLLLFLGFAAAAALTLANLAVEAEPGDPSSWTTFEPVELGVVGVVVDPAYSHADAKHPSTAPLVRDCLNRKGAYQSFLVDRNMKRYLRVCLLDNGQFGFQIVDQIKNEFYERTAYIRQELRGLNDLRNYVSKVGYSRFKGTIK